MFILAVSGIYGINPTNFEEQHFPMGIDLYVSPGDGRAIHTHFQLLYRNRLSTDATRRETAHSFTNDTFKPEINKQSEHLADKHRARMIEKANEILDSSQIEYKLPENGMISHEDLLIIHKRTQDLEMEMKR